jgi:hypothetical protein
MFSHARTAIATLLLIGCGSGSATKDAGSTAGSAGGSTGLGGRGGNVGGGGGLTGTAGLTGTGGTPVAMPTGSLVFQGSQASLLDLGPPCTWEDGATGDRWCGFIAPSVSMPANGELFVVNVTKAAAGVSITCGLADANCLKLTSTFAEDDIHRAMFQGDTLVFHDVAATPFGWRPGMTAARALAVADPNTADVLACTPSLKGTAVVCLRDLPMAMQTDPANLILSDVIAGKVDDAASPPLVRLETVISANRADGDVPRFQMGFPVPGSDVVAWSARATAAGPEILKMQTLGNDASRATVASDVNTWRASPDGTRWYWLSQVVMATGAGTLQSAPFPGGASPVAVAPNAIQYDFPTPTSLLVVDTAKQMLGFANPVTAPTTSVVVDTGVLAFVALSKQGHAGYAKFVNTTTGQTFTDLYVKKGDGTGACTLTTATDGYPFDFIFTPDSTGLAWIQRTTASILAQYTRLSDCTVMNVGSNVVWVEPIGNRAILFMDGFLTSTGTASMKFRVLATGAISAAPAITVSGQVGTFTVVSSGAADSIVYTVNAGGNEDGVYVRSFAP